MKIKTRFAPSPTGELHIGGARTALFCYLFAKSKSGEFLLRIEDTDRERLVEGSIKRIIDSLKWLGIEAENQNNPVIQSDRLEIYKKYAYNLVKEDKAYICNCSRERLGELRKKQIKSKLPTKYDRKCRGFKYQISNIKDMEKYLSKGGTVRLKMPESGEIVVDDLIRGKVIFDASLLDDQIILKSDRFPTYHLASVVDDHEMEISHVIRAEEWLSSTPKHLVLYQALSWGPPRFAHLPMILGPDKKKLSKRHGATSIEQYKKEGYLPETLINFMAFLGWNPKDERETFTLDELVKEFKLENVNKSSAIFDQEKLDHINAIKIKNKIENIQDKEKITNLLNEFNIGDISNGEIELIGRGGYKTLKEVAEYILSLRKEPIVASKMLVFKKSDPDKTKKGLEESLKALETISNEEWNGDIVQETLSKVVEENNLSNGDVFWPVRVALCGEEKSPSLVELAVALGKDKTIDRIEKALA